jgi:DNA-binding transcriptional regulator GbsR (MarR family)
MKDKNIESFIEESAILLEAIGFTRMAGRIIGYIMIKENDMIAFNDITRELKASKSSISTNLHVLLNANLIVKKTNPGDRKTYYSVNHNIEWNKIMARELKTLNIYRLILDKACTIRENKNDKTSQWAKRGTKYFDWLGTELNKLMKSYIE